MKVPSTAQKPMYGKLMTSAEFRTQAEAQEFGKEYKENYKQAGISIKIDIERTQNTQWKCNVWAKVD